MKYGEILKIDNKELTKHYIQSLTESQREDLVIPIFNQFRTIGLLPPDDSPDSLNKEYKRLVDCEIDLNKTSLFNNSSIGTKICKYFCPSFYKTTGEKNRLTMQDIFNDDKKLLKTIRNRLGMEWIRPSTNKKGEVLNGVNEAFSISVKMLVQGFRSQSLVAGTSLFKPDIAKYLCLKYSNEGDTVGDYSCGFGGRLLGAMATGRKYIGTDPLTTPELENMIKFYGFKDATLINSGSENYRGDENSIDFSFSSPPYFSQECYSYDKTQAYNNGEDYFYNTYWIKTLENCKYMLKADKWFGLNVKNYPKMLEMAIDVFGEVKEQITLATVRSHLTKGNGKSDVKDEYVYMFRNLK